MIGELRQSRVLVLGLGISGRSAAAYCAGEGARVVAADEGPGPPRAELGLPGGVELRVDRPFPDPADFDLVVPSPGIPLERFAGRARRVWGDLELLYRATPLPLIAVTGTNGKSTTVLLLEAMLREAGLRARAAGNLGVAALDLVGQPLDAAVLEVSSFQLDTIEAFRPRVAVLLNLSPDHLDRHGSYERYARAKARIFANQRAEDASVANAGDPAAWELAEEGRARRFGFALQGPFERGAWVDAGSAVVRSDPPPLRIALDGLRIEGSHNLENVLAALATCAAFGVDVARASRALRGFRGLPHRCELVARRAGVRFVDDSKATNVGAALRALEGFAEPLVWIAGGRDKHLDFAPLAEAAANRARAVVLLGEAAERLAAVLAGRLPIARAHDMDEAVERAAALARPGDVVLLAPACASFDQFESYAERGERFRQAVLALSGSEAAG